MERIIFWLETKENNYQEGLVLYESIANCNKSLLRNLKRSETPLNRQKLIYELKKHVGNFSAQKTIVAEVSTAPVAPSENNITESAIIESVKKEADKTTVLFHQLPKELRPVLMEANNLFKENCFLKSELNDLPYESEDSAITIMRKIDHNVKANKMAWAKIDYWLKHKQLPKEAKEVANYTMDQLIHQRNLLESSISRMYSRLRQNKELLDKASLGQELKLLQKISKQEKSILEKEEQLFKLKTEIDERK